MHRQALPLKGLILSMVFIQTSFSAGLDPCHEAFKDTAGSFAPSTVYLETLGRRIKIDSLIRIGHLKLTAKRKLFTELWSLGATVDVFDPTLSRYVQGEIEAIGLVEPYHTERAYLGLKGHRTLSLKDVEIFVIRTPIASTSGALLLRSFLPIELRLSRLSRNTIAILKAQSAGVMSVDELLSNPSTAAELRGAVSLGLAIPHYDLWVSVLGLQDNDEIYQRHRIDPDRDRDPIGKFMKVVKGRDKVFFVPRDFFTYPIGSEQGDSAGVTQAEFEYLMAHPDELARTYFLFGAYDAIANVAPYDLYKKSIRSLFARPSR